MKSIKDLRENYNLITEKEEHDMNKLTQLVRAGLFDAKKLSALKRAMDKPADKMTAQEKRMMINLLDALMSEVLSDKQVYRKIKQDVMKESVVVDTKDYLSKIDPRVKRYGYSQKDAPSVLLLKRKAIRVFPDGEKVALYYAQAIDKYVSIPFSEVGINENWITSAVRGIRDYLSSDSSSDNKKEEESVAKELKSLAREKTKLNVGGPKNKDDDGRPDAVRSRTERLNRLANQAMAKDVRESFINKLEVLREDDIDSYEFRMTAGLGGYTPYGGGAFGGGGRGGATRTSAQRKIRIDNPDIDPRTGKKWAVGAKPQSTTAGTKTKPSGPPTRVVSRRRTSPKEKPIEQPQPDRMPEFEPFKPDTSPRFPGKPANVPDKTKPSGPLDKPANEPGAPKPTTPKPVEPKPVKPKPGKRVEPDVKPLKPVPVFPERREPEIKPVPQKKPGIAPTHQPASQPATKPTARPGIAPTHQPASQSQPRPRQEQKPEAKTQTSSPKNRQRLKDKKDKRRKPFELPGIPAFDVGAKALSAMTPGLKLNISGPKKEGEANAIRSRQASIERAALKAQASIKESIELDGNVFELNNNAAQKVTALYESLNRKNKKKMVEMMNESAESLEKVISFAVRQ